MFLESLVSHSSLLLSPKCQAALEALGDRGRLLLVKCVGSATGLTLLQSNSWLQVINGNEMEMDMEICPGPQVPSSLGGTWRSGQIAFGQMCWVSHWPNLASVKLLAAGKKQTI